ncbi:serine/threonine protein kinase [Pyxidicoccus xibeiensis]|uniref:serine/threonine protein kinase n=1 Tax=Pyxidicoccus xibeiensis TaxID=2906759 RepID=UPI0020A6EDA3|nr:serine/threonine-protein kinase [Pyxidicoccus xibeiensis]MCP3144995.1 serine/threonine protein kinase [Pyxidicoccus xibeiensis]
MESYPLNPARLPPGTVIGRWRLLEQCGRGAFGVVYQAESVDGTPGVVALKLALDPGDARFVREAELLGRVHHPAVPRLLDHGRWQPRDGVSHAWLVMEWVEGVSLYDWALAQRPSSRQVLHLLARLARALEATHAAGGVHRDVKGDNIRVRGADGQPFLMDFGSGHHLGASTLTWHPFPPGTPAYRAPEAWRFVLGPGKPATVPYAPSPADDVFALGVTAYRLVTGEYPPSPHPRGDEAWLWDPDKLALWTASTRNARCVPELSALVSRMLSPRPEERGRAREVAEALERAARKVGPEADVPLFTGEERRPAGLFPPVQRVSVRRPTRAVRWSEFVAAGLGASLALGVGVLWSTRPVEPSEQMHVAEGEEAKDGGTIAVGDAALTAPVEPERAPSMLAAIRAELPPKPLPRQRRPDSAGRCSGKGLVAINGGCWTKLSLDVKDCDFATDGFVYKGACYVPVWTPQRPSTSGPANRDDAP